MAKNLKIKVLVAMSGGVDSSVAAALLKEKGYDVEGAFIRISYYGSSNCSSDAELKDARAVSEVLEIPLHVFDFSREYKEKVSDYMISGYSAGLTPNPDVVCNKEIKFGFLFKEAKRRKISLMATGHYAQIRNAGFNKGDQEPVIFEAKDKNKDQSYFLWAIKPEIIGSLIFPVGGYLKKEVRALARKFNLPVADKKDSQGICFLGKVKIEEFLEENIGSKPGSIYDTRGNLLGSVKNINFYTEGQRHGLDIKNGQGPYFVVFKNPGKNFIVVGREEEAPLIKRIVLSDTNIFTASLPSLVEVRTRYRQQKRRAKVCDFNEKRKELVLEFINPQKFIAKGQSGVLYEEERLLGGGIISDVVFNEELSVNFKYNLVGKALLSR